MKYLMICLVAVGSLASLPAVSSARDRSGEASAVADSLGLESGSYRVLSTTEAEQIRGTGGCLLPCIGLPNITAIAAVNANINVPCVLSVKANALAVVRVH